MLQAFSGFETCSVLPIDSGLINSSYRLESQAGPVAIIQKQHSSFKPEVNLDIIEITARLESAGLQTTSLLPTKTGDFWHLHEGACYRALAFLSGKTLHRVDHPRLARSAASLVGQFHNAVNQKPHSFNFARASVHDTAKHLAHLHEQMAKTESGSVEVTREKQSALALGRDILRASEMLPALPETPPLLAHGDLKISNILFDKVGLGGPLEAVAVIDLDTCAYMPLAHELGDALRSWSNTAGEDIEDCHANLDILDATVSGYRETANPTYSANLSTVGIGFERICIELASRFCADVFTDNYFGWNPEKFESRGTHNLIRARGQLALGLSVQKSRDAIAQILAD